MGYRSKKNGDEKALAFVVFLILWWIVSISVSALVVSFINTMAQ